MDLELKNLGMTLAIGGFAVYGILFIIKICRAKWVPRFFSVEEGKLQIQHAAVYLALVLATGIILEDVSKNYAARRTNFLSTVCNFFVDSDNELRLLSLFKDVELSDTKVKLTPKPIFRELQLVKPKHLVVEQHLAVINSHIPPGAGISAHSTPCTIDSKQNVEAFRGALDGLFYDAKTLVYRNDNYNKELTDISMRLDFSRALTILCLIFAFLYLLFSVFGFVPGLKDFLDIDCNERSKLITLTALYAIGICFAGAAYRIEQNNYNLRVFGYYISTRLYEDAPAVSPVIKSN